MTPALDPSIPLPTFTGPEPNQVEVNVFGPGVGECLVIHLGEGSWMVVDSCKGRGAKRPAALDYLEHIGADVEKDVEIIVATHWHDDHVRGISEVFDKAERAVFHLAASVRPDEFAALTGSPPVGSRFTSGVDELRRVVAVASQRAANGGPQISPVQSGRRIHMAPAKAVTEVWALSPSDEDLAISRAYLASLLFPLEPGVVAKRIPSQSPNDTSVVLFVDTVGGPLLLGGDLEHFPGNRLRGWRAVIDARGCPTTPAVFFKVPHHGSENADCDDVWTHRLNRGPICAVTPFDRGVTPLPRPSDRLRIRARGGAAFLTSDKRDRPIERDSVTRRTLRDSVRAYSPHTLRMGHLQLRLKDTHWTVAGTSEVVSV